MPAPSLPFVPSKNAQLGLLNYAQQIREANSGKELRQRFEYIDREFYRETNMTVDHQQATLANKLGDKRKLSDVVLPIVEPQVETAVSFLASVFLTGNPVFGVVAPPALMEDAKKMEAVIAENSTRGSWISELIMFFRDGEKYNLHGLELDWHREKIYSPIDVVIPGQQNKTDGSKELLWEGNCLKRMDPYNIEFDLRCPPHLSHKKAEFVGYRELYSRIALKQFIQDLPQKTNVTEAFASSYDEELYYIPQINPLARYDKGKLQGMMNWDSWASLDAKTKGRLDYGNLYVVCKRYIRIVPSDFSMNVPSPNTPQIWKMITVNDKVIIHMERCTNAHNYLPIVLGQPYNDGLGLQAKGIGEKLIPIQDIASTSWNLRLASQRRKISDRGLYDPSRISPSDVNSDNPSAKIPVKASVYGKSVGDAYHQIPFEDNQSGSFVQDAKEFTSFGNQISGQNPAQQGQFVKGNKTQAEFEDVQNKSSGRQRTHAIFIENQVFVPIKEMIKLNILQYQPDGQVLNPVDGQVYEIKKEELRAKSIALKLSDGLLPSDKLIPSEILGMALQVIGNSAQLMGRYNIAGLFTYLMSLRGADLKPFELTPEQLLEARRVALTTKVAETAGISAAEQAGQPVAQPAA